MLCYDPSMAGKTADSYPFARVRYLYEEYGIPAALIVDEDYTRGIIVLEDLGGTHLADIAAAGSEDETLRYYRESVDLLVKIQQIPASRISSPVCFDTAKLMYEFDFFYEHALKSFFKADMNSPAAAELRSLFIQIASKLDRPEYFITAHRDYHSRNLMVKNKGLRVIDFQDSMPGLPQYDLVSLLRDSYTELSPVMFNSLKNYYYEESKDRRIHSMRRDEFEYYFELAGLQRNVKALGTFAYQSAVRGKIRYEENIPLTFSYIKKFSDSINELRRAVELLDELGLP